MVKKVKLIKHKERKSRVDAGNFLQQLAEKIASGQVVLQQHQDDLVLDIPHNLSMKIKVNKKNKRVKGTRHKMTIQFQWYEDDKDAPLSLG